MLALIDPFSGIAGDMVLGALVDLGLEPAFLERLPGALGLHDVRVRIERVQRAGIGAVKVDFDIPAQPHGRHLAQINAIVDAAPLDPRVKARALDAFTLIATVEARVHGTTIERVHLHEVGAVDAILDIVGAVWGFAELGVNDVRCGTIALGDGSVQTDHGIMPVPAPATADLLTGQSVRAGPDGSGELTTPTGAALVRVLATGGFPPAFVPIRVGYGAGTRDVAGRPNVLRVTLAEGDAAHAYEPLVMLATDIDDATAESVAAAADALRSEGAHDVTISTVLMKKGRPGMRLEVLCAPADAPRFERSILMKTSSIGVRRTQIFRRALDRAVHEVTVLGHAVRVKISTLPDGTERMKAESDDVRRVTLATGIPGEQISALAVEQARRVQGGV